MAAASSSSQALIPANPVERSDGTSLEKWFEEESQSEDEASDAEAPTNSKEDASEALVDYLVGLQTKGKLHANDVCILAHHACSAGAVGDTLKRVAMEPGKSSGNYSRHLQSALKLSYPTEPYELTCPGRLRKEPGRTMVTLPVLPMQELLQKELEANAKAEASLSAATLPPNYHSHPVVRSNADKTVWPLSLYVDGVPVTKRDGLVAVTMTNLATGHRWLLAAVKRSHMCRCGCKGWCTMYHLMAWLRYCITALAQGRFPTHRADGTPFTDKEPLRKGLAGKDGPCAAIVQLKADWAEFAHTLAFPTWSSKTNPCMFCNCSYESMTTEMPKCSKMHSPWRAKTQADLEAYCSRAEQRCIGSQEEWRMVVPCLQYDTRKQGNRGRCLAKDVPALQLRAGDRLEPSPTCPDIGVSLQALTQFPKAMVFWRMDAEEPVRHRNPLWCPELGVTTEILCIDTLHTLALGLCSSYVARAVWFVLDSNPYDLGSSFSQDERHTRTLQRMQPQLQRFYKETNHRWTDVGELRMEIFGKRQSPQLHLKGHQTLGLLHFLHQFIHTSLAEAPQSKAWGKVCGSVGWHVAWL